MPNHPPPDAKQIIITTQSEAAAVAIGEIQKLDSGARVTAQLTPEARLISLPGGYNALLRALPTAGIVFIRHMFPVQYASESLQIDTWLSQACGIFDKHDAFSVQMRAAPRDDALYARAMETVRTAEEMLTSHGFTNDDRNPAWVVSLFMYSGTMYAGVSWCVDNRSGWNGGAMRFKKDESFISRAEFKLLEAFEVFGYTPPTDAMLPRRALDLGAAPGGWTQLLLERHFQVTAVDPAALSDKLSAHPGLSHARVTAQHFHGEPGSYDLIVNDMRMDMFESSRVMLDMRRYLRTGGAGLMTLKLSTGHWYQKTMKALALLEKSYHIEAARQLFHNRDEVTVFMRNP